MVEILVRHQRKAGGRWVLPLAAASLLLAGCASVPEERSAADAPAAAGYGDFDEIEVLTEALMLTRRHYVKETEFRELVHKAVDGMLAGLDPNCAFLPPRSLAELEEEACGSFCGIGVSIGMDEGAVGVKVIAPIEDSPAFRAGIHAGDVITSVDGKKTEGASIEEVTDAIKGSKGSSVKLTVERENGETRDIALVRDDIKISSVKGALSLGDGIGYVRITMFSGSVAEDFAEALARLDRDGVSGVVVDLRDNPGGLLEAAVAVAEQLLPQGREIVTVRGRGGIEQHQRFDAGPCAQRLTDLPMVLLVNRGSASAAEVLAGALQAHKRAVLVGEKTYGKASVQSVIGLSLRPDCAIRLTTGYYYTPDGRMIHGQGIAPDIEVVVPQAEWRQAQRKRLIEDMPGAAPGGMAKMVEGIRDEQLERARSILKGARIINGG